MDAPSGPGRGVPSLLTKQESWRGYAGKEGTPMLTVAVDEGARAEFTLGLDEICREGARRMLAAALEAEADAYVASLADEV